LSLSTVVLFTHPLNTSRDVLVHEIDFYK